MSQPSPKRWGVGLMGLALLVATAAHGAPSGAGLGAALGLFALGALLMGGGAEGLATLPARGLIALGALALLQILPLPEPLWRALTPGSVDRFGAAPGPLGHLVSLAPADTLQAALFLLLGGLGLRALTGLGEGERRHLRWWVAGSLMLVLLWAALQTLGLYTPLIEARRAARPFVNPLGPFLNRDHGAAFALMAFPLTLPLWRGGPWRRGLGALMGTASLALVVASESRGALLGLGGGIWGVALAASLLKGRRRLALGCLAALPVGVALAPTLLWAVSWATGKVPGLGLRGAIWRDGVGLLMEQPWLGWGAGTFGAVIPLGWRTQGGFFPAHAHSEPLELLIELGAVGGGIALAVTILSALRLAGRLWGARGMGESWVLSPESWAGRGERGGMGGEESWVLSPESWAGRGERGGMGMGTGDGHGESWVPSPGSWAGAEEPGGMGGAPSGLKTLDSRPVPPLRWELLGGIAALSAALSHSLVEFQLHLGSIALLGLMALALTLGAADDLPGGDASPSPWPPSAGPWARPAIALVAGILALTFILPTWPKAPVDLRLEALFRGPAPYEACATSALTKPPGDAQASGRAQRCGARALSISPLSRPGALGVLAGAARAGDATPQDIARLETLAATRWEGPWQRAFAHLARGEGALATPLLREAVLRSRVGLRPRRIAQLWRQPGAAQWMGPLTRAFPEESLKAAQRLAVLDHPAAPLILEALGPAAQSLPGGRAWALLLSPLPPLQIPAPPPTAPGAAEDPYALIKLGHRAALSGDADLALASLAQAQRAPSSEIQALAALALLRFKLKEPSDLADALLAAHGPWPQDPELRGALAEALLRGHRYAEATALLKKWVSLEPERPHVQHSLGESLRAQGDPEGARHVDLARRGESRHPLFVEALCRCPLKIRAERRNGAVALHR